ncbi:MAG: hypothetical protein IPK65_06895 [Gammaproteobacteria bacterium]|nr:hypothetical protein [Gammaproteobacteria bacterium]
MKILRTHRQLRDMRGLRKQDQLGIEGLVAEIADVVPRLEDGDIVDRGIAR